jgi:hypothetical protein
MGTLLKAATLEGGRCVQVGERDGGVGCADIVKDGPKAFVVNKPRARRAEQEGVLSSLLSVDRLYPPLRL